ncbi:MAG: hypothetical protein WDM84_09425 [Bauldia sp.]
MTLPFPLRTLRAKFRQLTEPFGSISIDLAVRQDYVKIELNGSVIFCN